MLKGTNTGIKLANTDELSNDQYLDRIQKLERSRKEVRVSI